MGNKRYAELDRLIAEVKPETIIEVGVWNGHRAMQMATEALKHRKSVHYTGYDLFEGATSETDRLELNAKAHHTLNGVTETLKTFQKKNPGFSFELVKGNTNDTMGGKDLVADFVYIDGGHSVETIQNDFDATKNSKCIVFDDYYLPLNGVLEWDLDEFGANRVADPYKPEIIDTDDLLIGKSMKKGTHGGKVAYAVLRGHQEEVESMIVETSDDVYPAKLDHSFDEMPVDTGGEEDNPEWDTETK